MISSTPSIGHARTRRTVTVSVLLGAVFLFEPNVSQSEAYSALHLGVERQQRTAIRLVW
jgi:hypothetical protein